MPTDRITRTAAWALLGLTLAAAAAVAQNPASPANPPAATRPAADAPAEGPVGVTIDFETFLRDTQLTGGSLTDGVWTLTAPSGRRLTAVPMTVLKVTQETPLEPSAIGLAGGQFVGWFVPPPPGDPQALNPKPIEVGPPVGQVFTTAPRLAHDVRLTPDGQIRWKLARSLAGGKAGPATQLYADLIDRSLLGRPEPPPRIVRNNGESAAAYNQRRAQAMEEHHRKTAAWQAVNKALTELPTEFHQPAPPTVYAIFYIPAHPVGMVLTGPRPLPWRLPADQFEKLRTFAAGHAEPGDLRPLLTSLMASGDPTSARAAGVVLAANLNCVFRDDSELVGVATKLLADGPTVTRRQLIEAMIRRPDVTIAPFLLGKAAHDPDPEVALLALRALTLRQTAGSTIDSPATQQESAGLIAQTAARLLRSDTGPTTEQILAPIFVLSARNPAVAAGFGRADFSHVAASRRGPLVKIILRFARHGDPVANAWLDQSLLGSADPALVKLTLQQIAGHRISARTDRESAAPSATAALPVPGDPRGELFEPAALELPADGPRACQVAPPPSLPQPRPIIPRAPQIPGQVGGGSRRGPIAPPRPPHNAPAQLPGGPVVIPGTGPEAAQPQTPPDSDPAAPLALPTPTNPAGPLVLGSSKHRLIALLSDGDAALRELAWEALPRFVLGPAADPAAESERDSVCAAIAEAAVKSPGPTPPNAALFFAGVTDTKRRTAGLMTILGGGRGEGQSAALLAVAASGAGPLTEALVKLTPEQRQNAALLWYTSAMPVDREHKPADWLAAPILREPGIAATGVASPVMQWFAQQMTSGRRPAALEWANAMGNDALVAGLMSGDREYAGGCAAALIARALPPDERAVAKLREEAGRIAGGVKDPAEQAKQAAMAWKKVTDEAVAQRLASSSGAYTLEVFVTAPGEAAEGATRVVVGEVKLTFSGKQVATEPKAAAQLQETPLRIVLSEPGEFAAAGSGPEAAKLNWPKTAVEMTLDDRGRWTGGAITPDQGRMELVLVKK